MAATWGQNTVDSADRVLKARLGPLPVSEQDRFVFSRRSAVDARTRPQKHQNVQSN